jgi:signal transduction histidine kinase
MMVATRDIAELESRLSTTEEPRLRIDLLNELAWLLRQQDLERAIALSEEAYHMAGVVEDEDDSYEEGAAKSLHQLGRFHLWRAEFKSAIRYFLDARTLYEKLGDRENVGMQLGYIGAVYGRSGNLPEALEYLIEAQKIYTEVGNRELEASGLNNLGYAYVLLGQPAEGLPYLERGLDILRDLDLHREQMWFFDSLCHAHLGLEHYPEALECGLQSVRVARETEESLGEAGSRITVGEVYLAMGERERALEYLQQALEIAESQHFRREHARALERMGEVYRRQGKTEEAARRLQTAMDVAHEIGDKELEAKAHHTFSLVQEQEGQLGEALEHFKAFHALKEEVFNEDADNRLKTLQVAYAVETAQREAAIAHLKNVALQEEIKERQQAELALQEEITAHQALIADLDAFAHMVAHDLKNPIHTVAGYSEVLQDRLADREDALLVEVEFAGTIHRKVFEMSRIIDTMLLLARVRQEDVEREMLEMGPVVAAAERRLERLLQETQGEIVKPETWPRAWGYGPWVEEVWENYLSNALKYGGHPPRVEVGATVQPDGYVKFWVRDNGPGISVEQRARLFTPFTRLSRAGKEGHGVGLSIVQRIIETLGGEVGVESVQGEGSTFFFTLPGEPSPEVRG